MYEEKDVEHVYDGARRIVGFLYREEAMERGITPRCQSFYGCPSRGSHFLVSHRLDLILTLTSSELILTHSITLADHWILRQSLLPLHHRRR